jgi:beta-glucanase (GH16 family)
MFRTKSSIYAFFAVLAFLLIIFIYIIINNTSFFRFKPYHNISTLINNSGFKIDSTTFDKVKYPATLHDKKYLLQLLPDDYYKDISLQKSFQKTAAKPDSFFITATGIDMRLQPFGYSERKNFLFEFTYPPAFNYTFLGDKPKIPSVCFPHPDLTKDSAWAIVKLKNTLPASKTVYVRLFYQNTSYWFPTNDSIKNDSSCLDNFYGCSATYTVILKGGELQTVKLPYKIGYDPKNNLKNKPKWLISARPGNYEFMTIISEHEDDPLMSADLNLNKINPFAVVKKDELHNKGKQYFNNIAYVGPHHFKFVFVDDDFDGHNDLRTTAVYIAKNNSQKKLCDTCNGNWFKNVISDNWTDDDFFKGYIAKAKKIQVEYGNRKENFYFSNGKAVIKIPGSTAQKKQKTWGEFFFEPSFKYGHVMIRAKFAQMFNKAGRPNGIIHNLWLYQRDFLNMPPDPKNPYHYLINAQGNQPFEIDFEIWSSRFLSQAWDSNALINYSVVDYMRNANVSIKPGEQKKVGKYTIDRVNKYQANITGTKFDNTFFNYYHLYEIYWTPTYVRYLVDGEEKAYFTNKEVKIPDQELYLWIGSPIYQDGTYYSQTNIPFIPYDSFSEIDWIRIE